MLFCNISVTGTSLIIGILPVFNTSLYVVHLWGGLFEKAVVMISTVMHNGWFPSTLLIQHGRAEFFPSGISGFIGMDKYHHQVVSLKMGNVPAPATLLDKNIADKRKWSNNEKYPSLSLTFTSALISLCETRLHHYLFCTY